MDASRPSLSARAQSGLYRTIHRDAKRPHGVPTQSVGTRALKFSINETLGKYFFFLFYFFMKKLSRLFFSMELSGILLILFTASIAIATFIENDFGTLTAKATVYNAKWFEIMLLLLAVNMIGSIIKRKMYRRAKWPIFIFHVSFIIILLGAAVTRYIGYEGAMAIREGQSSNEMRTSDTFIRIWVDDGQDKAFEENKVFATPSEVNGFSESISLNSNTIDVEVLDYVPNASEEYFEEEEDKGGYYQANDQAHISDSFLSATSRLYCLYPVTTIRVPLAREPMDTEAS